MNRLGGSSNSQFQDNADHFVVLVRIIQLNDFGMLQAILHVDFALNIFAFFPIWHGDEFRREAQTRGFLFAFVNCPKFSSKSVNKKNVSE